MADVDDAAARLRQVPVWPGTGGVGRGVIAGVGLANIRLDNCRSRSDNGDSRHLQGIEEKMVCGLSFRPPAVRRACNQGAEVREWIF